MNVALMLFILAKSTLVLAAGLLAVRLARKRPAAVRHLLLAATFAVAAIVPVASVLAPPVDIALPLPAPAASMSPGGVAGDAARVTTNRTTTSAA
jgi:hypothetical protein